MTLEEMLARTASMNERSWDNARHAEAAVVAKSLTPGLRLQAEHAESLSRMADAAGDEVSSGLWGRVADACRDGDDLAKSVRSGFGRGMLITSYRDAALRHALVAHSRLEDIVLVTGGAADAAINAAKLCLEKAAGGARRGDADQLQVASSAAFVALAKSLTMPHTRRDAIVAAAGPLLDMHQIASRQTGIPFLPVANAETDALATEATFTQAGGAWGGFGEMAFKAKKGGDSGWRTVHGTHVHFGSDGRVDKGPAHMVGKTPSEFSSSGAPAGKTHKDAHSFLAENPHLSDLGTAAAYNAYVEGGGEAHPGGAKGKWYHDHKKAKAALGDAAPAAPAAAKPAAGEAEGVGTPHANHAAAVAKIHNASKADRAKRDAEIDRAGKKLDAALKEAAIVHAGDITGYRTARGKHYDRFEESKGKADEAYRMAEKTHDANLQAADAELKSATQSVTPAPEAAKPAAGKSANDVAEGADLAKQSDRVRKTYEQGSTSGRYDDATTSKLGEHIDAMAAAQKKHGQATTPAEHTAAFDEFHAAQDKFTALHGSAAKPAAAGNGLDTHAVHSAVSAALASAVKSFAKTNDGALHGGTGEGDYGRTAMTALAQAKKHAAAAAGESDSGKAASHAKDAANSIGDAYSFGLPPEARKHAVAALHHIAENVPMGKFSTLSKPEGRPSMPEGSTVADVMASHAKPAAAAENKLASSSGHHPATVAALAQLKKAASSHATLSNQTPFSNWNKGEHAQSKKELRAVAKAAVSAVSAANGYSKMQIDNAKAIHRQFSDGSLTADGLHTFLSHSNGSPQGGAAAAGKKVPDAASANGEILPPDYFGPMAKKSLSAARAEWSDVAKGGGPFIGPRGGKYADAQHKVAWTEPSAGASHQQAAHSPPHPLAQTHDLHGMARHIRSMPTGSRVSVGSKEYEHLPARRESTGFEPAGWVATSSDGPWGSKHTDDFSIAMAVKDHLAGGNHVEVHHPTEGSSKVHGSQAVKKSLSEAHAEWRDRNGQ